MNIKCIKCKGADPVNSCGRTFCPLIAKYEARFKVQKNLEKEDFFGSAPAPFVGRFGYPNVNVGILSPPEIREDAWLYDAPNTWAREDFDIPKIVDFRSALINSRFNANIHDRDNRMLEISQEVGMASKPVDVEINLEKKPVFRLNTDAYLAPSGPNAKLKKAMITENPKIDSRVDKAVNDTDLKANNALTYLFERGFDENFLSKLLSVGTLGIHKNRKLVPTRWSITATDDALGKHIHKKIIQFPEYGYFAYFGSYLGNYYLVLMFPDNWSYELFETYMPKASWNVGNEVNYTTDYEPFAGRKNYAENCAGGYYTARLAVLEKLAKLRRQSSVLTIRIITGEYAMPLGVWVTREAARKSLMNKPLEFSTKELMLDYAKKLINKKFGYDISNILKGSILLKNLNKQRKIMDFHKP